MHGEVSSEYSPEGGVGFMAVDSCFSRGLGLSHLLFADDVLLFWKATKALVQLITDTLDEFCQSSGLRVNFEKSHAMCSSKVSRARKDKFTSVSSINIVGDLGKYLGFPLINGIAKTSK